MSIFIMLVVFVITSHNPDLVQANVRSKSPDDTYKVYSALIRKRYVKESTNLILVFAETSPNPDRQSPPDREDLRRILIPMTQSTIDSYKAKGQDIRDLLNEFDLPVKYMLIKKAEWDEMFKVDIMSGWESLYRKYPEASGIIRLSEIGFNAEHTQALVFVMHGCGATCAEGGYVLLSKEGEDWRIEKQITFMFA